jgi:hypothetical protein
VKPGSLMDPLTTRFAALAAALGLVGFALAGLRWLRRRGGPVPGSVEAVDFSGRRRTAFLERVWSQRIVNCLERSLQHAAEMNLGVRNTPDLVKPSYAQSTAEPGELLTVEEAFDQAGGQLLIVGPPGSGKTSEALKLMRHLIEVARGDPSAPVPEIFPLASWAKERKPLLEWLADELQLRHGWSPRQGRSLIWDHYVVPVLDGLDEVASESRAECLEEINRFWETYRDGPIVLCSRQAEYEELSEKLKLGGGVTVCPPDAQQIDEYLAAAGESWDGVRAQLRAGSSPFLRELLTTPLMLSIAVLAYQNQNPSELSEGNDAATQRERLWSQYVAAMTTRGYGPPRAEPPATVPYTEEQVRRWLGWLAREMRSRNETELWLHEWCGPTSFRTKVRVATGLVLGLGLGFGLGLPPQRHLKFDLIFGLVFAAVFALLGERIMSARPAYRLPLHRRRAAASLARWLRVGLFSGPPPRGRFWGGVHHGGRCHAGPLLSGDEVSPAASCWGQARGWSWGWPGAWAASGQIGNAWSQNRQSS